MTSPRRLRAATLPDAGRVGLGFFPRCEGVTTYVGLSHPRPYPPRVGEGRRRSGGERSVPTPLRHNALDRG